MKEIEVITEILEHASEHLVCVGCGSKYPARFALRTSATGRQVMPWCRQCAEKVALFLIRAWENPTLKES